MAMHRAGLLSLVCAGLSTTCTGTVTAATVITDLAPDFASKDWDTKLTLTGTIAAGDKFGFSTSSDCTSATLADAAAEVTYKFIATGTMQLCFQDSGKTVAVQTDSSIEVIAATLATIVTDVAPDSGEGWKSVEVNLTGSGIVEGDQVALVGDSDCKYVSSNSLGTVDSDNQVTLKPNGVGTLIMCYQDGNGTDFIKQTGSDVNFDATAPSATPATSIDALMPKTGALSSKIDVLLDGFVNTGDQVAFTTAADCTGVTDKDWLEIPANKKVAFVPLYSVAHILCYQLESLSDKIKQTNSAVHFTVTAAAGGTTDTLVTKITPTTASQGTATTFTLDGTIVADDEVALTSAADCTAITAFVNISATKTFAFTPSAAGKFYVCYRKKGTTDSIWQSKAEQVTVSSATPATAVTGAAPATGEKSIKLTLTLTGTIVPDDKVALMKAADCTGVETADWLTVLADKKVEFTPSAAGDLIVCAQLEDSSDAVKQTGAAFIVTEAGQISSAATASTWICLLSAALLMLGFGLF